MDRPVDGMGLAVAPWMRKLAFLLSAAILASTSGCTETEIMEDDESKNDEADVLGAYAVVTPIELGQAVGNLPALGPALVELRTADANPGEAVLDALQAADVGRMSTLLKAMPSALRADLVTRANVFLDPVKGDIVRFAGQLEQIVQVVQIHSEIRITDRKKITGITDEEHTIRKVEFTLDGKSAAIDVANVTDAGHGRVSSDGEADLNDVELAISIGPLAIEAANRLVFPQFGATDLNGALASLIDCQQLGGAIEDVVSFVDAEGACRDALSSLAAKVSTATAEAKDELTIAITDATGTIKNGAIADGAWTWNVELGSFQKELMLKFQAKRP